MSSKTGTTLFSDNSVGVYMSSGGMHGEVCICYGGVHGMCVDDHNDAVTCHILLLGITTYFVNDGNYGMVLVLGGD